MAVAGAAGIPQLAAQPTKAVLQQSDGLLALGSCLRSGRRIAAIQQLHQGRCELFSSPALRLAFQGMPVAVVDGEQAVQRFSCLTASIRPLLRGGHWTNSWIERHPGAMQQRPRSPHQPIRWLHQLASLMAQVSRAERLPASDESLQARRLRQRMALAQRLLDPLPQPLQPTQWHEQVLWRWLRWGGVGLALALWLRR
ncbi:MAG: hypothetical protein RLZZ631_952 [Cyanobacteriota bacterium]